jgi:transcriptional regulator with XRE-family HTH domain
MTAEGVMVFPPGPPPLPLPKRRYPALGARLLAGRRARELTQEYCAEVLGVSHSSLGGWEQGKRRPRPPLLRHLATVLDIPYADLAALAEYNVDVDG